MSKIKRRKTPVHHAKDAGGHFIRIPIREVRPSYFLVDIHTGDGRRERKCFSGLDQAKLYCTQKDIEIKNQGLSVFNLTDNQRRDAMDALRLLQGTSTLRQAAEEFIRRHPPRGAEKISFTAWRYLRAMKKRDARPLSIKDKLFKFRVFIRSVGKDAPTSSFDSKDVERWVDHAGYRGHSRRGYLRAINALLNFFHGRLRERQNADDSIPVVWKPIEVMRLFHAAEENASDIIPALVLMFFAGIRPHEMMRLRWENVNLAEKLVTIGPDVAKTRTAREIVLSENAMTWLVRYHKSKGSISGGASTFRRLREQAMKKAGIKSWPVDVARHTFATAHYVESGDLAKTMSQLGHFGNPGVFTRHYKGLLTRKEALEYWAICPAENAKIIRFNAAG